MEIEQNKNILNPPPDIESTERKNRVQSTSEIAQKSVDKQSLNTESKASVSSVKISSEGKLIQALDETSDKIDTMLEKNMTNEQKKNLDEIYQQLDGLFESEDLSQKQEKKVTALFEQADKIYNTSIEKLSSSEHETIDKLANKMESLSAQLAQYENNNPAANKQANNGGNTRNSEVTSRAITSGGSELSDVAASKKKSKKKALTVAQLNALSIAELNKLPPSELKKLNAKQLNKLNANLLNTLALPQLKQLSNGNIGKLNQTQQDKLA
ncbi:hypothetical protein [Cognaticolwellia mytili]|uniref:hypothetical protein n=1 Tax=Cognaticolwellia mytili TaxID=1888913 RepID=UPI000A1746E9|nr:hypothetical protein [Cognaticolwellia mytili]